MERDSSIIAVVSSPAAGCKPNLQGRLRAEVQHYVFVSSLKQVVFFDVPTYPRTEPHKGKHC